VADPSIETHDPAPARERPALLVVGAASRDIDPTDKRGWRLGGTVSYGALAAARLGLRVRALVGADSEAAAAHELDTLRAARVDVVVVPLAHGPVFENRQMGNARRQYVHGLSDTIPVSALPAQWREPTAVLLGPVANELRDEWVNAIPAGALVALAWQGLVRELAVDEPVRLRPLTITPLVRRSDVLFVSAEDIAAGGPPLDKMLRQGQEIFITVGEHGALHITRSGEGRPRINVIPPRPRRTPIDTTGAGDTFLAAYVAARLCAPQLAGTRDEWRLEAIAAGTASLNIVAPTLAHVPTLPELYAALATQRS
jgi:sugar/nucleoside kinase (ribokinase family)